MMPAFNRLKKPDDMIEKPEHLPKIVKRCPKCNNLSLTYDPSSGKISCTKCGFEENLQMI